MPAPAAEPAHAPVAEARPQCNGCAKSQELSFHLHGVDRRSAPLMSRNQQRSQANMGSQTRAPSWCGALQGVREAGAILSEKGVRAPAVGTVILITSINANRGCGVTDLQKLSVSYLDPLVLLRSPAFWPTMILSTAETADVRPIFPQKPLQLLRIQAIRDPAEVHDADRTRGRKPAFTQDLNAPVRI